jgi:hypothetical protein
MGMGMKWGMVMGTGQGLEMQQTQGMGMGMKRGMVMGIGQGMEMQQTQGVVGMRWGMVMRMEEARVVVGRQRPGWVATPQGLVESLPLQGEARRR